MAVDFEKKADDLLRKLKALDAFDDNAVIDFGKYKGQKLGEVPNEYLVWLLTDTDLVNKMKLCNYIVNCLPAILSLQSQAKKNKK